MYMNTLSTNPSATPMVRVIARRPGARMQSPLTLAELLEDTRINHPRWWAVFEDSRLAAPGAADLDACAELVSSSPCERLRGYVEGLFEAN